MHGGLELLAGGANTGLEAHHVEIEIFAPHHALHKIGEATLRASGKKHVERVFLLHRQLDEGDDMLIPPAFPCARLLLVRTCAGCGQYARIVPPAAIDKHVRRRELADGDAIPYLLIGQRAGKEGVVEVVNVDGFDVGDGRQVTVIARPSFDCSHSVVGLLPIRACIVGGRSRRCREHVGKRAEGGWRSQAPCRAEKHGSGQNTDYQDRDRDRDKDRDSVVETDMTQQ
jgi:hypothetical protein